MNSTDDTSIRPPEDSPLLPRHLCRVIGINQNFSSTSGGAYHVQIEDRGPVFDDATEAWVRRINVIVYANYGEPTARIVYGKDHDLPDLRTHKHNKTVARRVQELAAEARQALEEKEQRQVLRIQGLLRRYYDTRDEAAKRQFEEANALHPLVFARAFRELRGERARATAAPAASGEPVVGEPVAAESEEIVYPLDAAQRDVVLDIERVAQDMERDLGALQARGAADDILRATCAKLLARARETLVRRDEGDFAWRRMVMTRKSLLTAYHQVRARLSRAGGA